MQQDVSEHGVPALDLETIVVDRLTLLDSLFSRF